jgi:IS30 family transposase
MMKRINKAGLSEITQLLTEGLSADEIAVKLNERGSTTPNGIAWNGSNIGYYKSRYKLSRRAARSAKSATTSPDLTGKDESIFKIKTILGLNLSRETTLKALAELV